MPGSVSAGITFAQLPTAVNYDPVKGVVRKYQWRGTQVELESLMPGLRALGYKFAMDPENDSPLWTLTVDEPDQEPVETWSLKGNDIEKSIWTAKDVRDWWDLHRPDLSARAKDRKVVEDYVTGGGSDSSSANRTKFDALIAESGGVTESPFAKIALAMVNGQEAYPVSQWVLRHTVSVGWLPHGKKLDLSTNVGKVFRSTAAMVTRDNVPIHALPFVLPEGEWLKRTPNGDMSGSWRWQIDHEYWWAEHWNWPLKDSDE